jgi:SpoVK/Ycf46/Vps4 family AAA+-type ATPase
MATADQIKALIRSHYSEKPEQFYTIALQVAAHESRQGHSALAHDIRELIDKERKNKSKVIQFPKNLQGLVITEESQISKNSMVIPKSLLSRIDNIIHEYRQQEKLKSHGLTNRRKILLIGSPGTGKTMTARVLAHEIKAPIHTIQVDRLVTKFMGETSAKLRLIFDHMKEEHGVYLFDEFDAIGGERSLDNDVGEMRRVLNAFLQFIEQDTSDSLIIAATNNPKLLDQALHRRFDDILFYEYPAEEERKALISNVLGTFKSGKFSWKKVIANSEELSQAEIAQACMDAIKSVILSNKEKVNSSLLSELLMNRKNSKRGMLKSY